MALSEKDKERYVEIWSKAIETQMHFNEMCVKFRQLGLTFVAAALGVGLVLLSKHEDFFVDINLCGWLVKIHVSPLIVLGSAAAMYAVRILDIGVYHKMLRGAVSFGEDFERNYMKEIFDLEKGMTQAISHFSRYEDAKIDSSADKYHYIGENKKSAEVKIRNFYFTTILFLIVISAILMIATTRIQSIV